MLFDQCDFAKLQCYNVKGCIFQFTNEEGSLLDDHKFFFDELCSQNSIEKVSIIPGTNPGRCVYFNCF